MVLILQDGSIRQLQEYHDSISIMFHTISQCIYLNPSALIYHCVLCGQEVVRCWDCKLG